MLLIPHQRDPNTHSQRPTSAVTLPAVANPNAVGTWVLTTAIVRLVGLVAGKSKFAKILTNALRCRVAVYPSVSTAKTNILVNVRMGGREVELEKSAPILINAKVLYVAAIHGASTALMRLHVNVLMDGLAGASTSDVTTLTTV